MNVYRIVFTNAQGESVNRVIAASSMGNALSALSQALPNAVPTEVKLIATNLIITQGQP